MTFKKFRAEQQKHIADRMANHPHLFITDVDSDVVWNTYLDSFPDGTNEIYRVRREFDCSCCRHYMREFANVVAITEDGLVSIWDFEPSEAKFKPVVKTLSYLVKSGSIRDVLVTKQSGFGTESNVDKDVVRWNHFRVELPEHLILKSHKTEQEVRLRFRENREMVERAVTEISPYAIETALELITEGVVYRGEEWKSVLEKFKTLSQAYHNSDNKDLFLWKAVVSNSDVLLRIRNHSIGVLLTDLSEGMAVDKALKRFENVMAPANYQRPKAKITPKMVDNAEQEVIRLGLKDSLPRRHAQLSDVSVNNVLWVNRDAAKVMDRQGGIFDVLRDDIEVDPSRFERIPSIPITEMVDRLNEASTLEVLVENRHEGNLVSLIAPEYQDSKNLFKWSNGFSWSYKGNAADSMREQVRAAGGNVDGVLRCSLRWNHESHNPNDFDLHCIEPSGNEIFFGNKYPTIHKSSGVLDVDIIHPTRGKVAVENITWTDRKKMDSGTYKFFVHNYSYRGGKDGFETQIEFNGTIFNFVYPRKLRQNERVEIATIEYNPNKGIKFLTSLPFTTSMDTKEVWGLKTNRFHTVSTFMFSPNYWDGDNVGNRHYFFFVADAMNPDETNGFFNEYLRPELRSHGKVFEVLASKMKVQPAEDQLSGLGFSSTIRNSMICRIDGQVVKVVF